jgi:hypothetical protein
MTTAATPSRRAPRRFGWIGVVALVLIALVLGGGYFVANVWNGPNAHSAAGDMGKIKANGNISNCSVFYDALSADQKTNNPAKVQNGVFINGAIGTPVTQRDESGIKSELQQRRTCGTDGKFDPELTATQYADWSAEGLTTQKVAFADIDAFRAKMVADHSFYNQIESELTTLENASTFSIKSVKKGIWSVYEVPDGNGGLTTHVGTTTMDGTAAVFTYKGKTIMYRLECGFQILRPHQPPGLPVCTQAGCKPTCEELNGGKACKIGSQDPAPSGHAARGGGKNDQSGPGEKLPVTQPAPVYTPPAQAPAPAPSASASPDPTATPAPHESTLPTAPVTGCVPTPTTSC